MFDDETPALDKFIGEIERLKLARELLEELYYAIGNYELGRILNESPYTFTQNLSTRIDDYFHFDDSE